VVKKKLFHAIGAISLLLGMSSCGEPVECCTFSYPGYSSLKVCEDGTFASTYVGYGTYTGYYIGYKAYWSYYKTQIIANGGTCETERK
jgi:hypothetical protein